jgi:tetratricopeptide (TPR) repeat protein
MKNSTLLSGLTLAIFLFFVMDASAQSKVEARGDRLMEKYSFMEATKVLKKALKKEKGENDRIKKKLAECYRMLNDPENTVFWYQDIMDNASVIESDDKFFYAQALSSMGDYPTAREWFKIYSEETPSDGRSKKYAAHLDNLGQLYKDSSRFQFEAVSFNSATADFSPAYYKEGLVFVSGRSEQIGKYNWNKSEFLDLYQCVQDSAGNYSKPTSFYKKLNTRYHEGPISFYNNGRNLVLTQNNLEKGSLIRSSDGVTKLKMYFSSIDDEGKWSESVPFQYNSDEYSVGHPTITEDGRTLYFISDMEGGYGGTDIYVSKFNGSLWSIPQNLGPEVNTLGNEMFPFFHQNEILYFASNGHGGLGGLDVYKYEFSRRKLSNIGYPINSKKDDFGLIVNAPGNKGYIASNRNSRNGVDNIYSFEFFPLINLYYDFSKCIVREETEIELVSFGHPDLVITKDGRSELTMELDKLVKLLAYDPTLVLELSSHTDSRGTEEFNLSLSAKRTRSAKEYIVSQGIDASRIISNAYGESRLLNECADGVECSEEEHQVNRRTEFKVMKY